MDTTGRKADKRKPEENFAQRQFKQKNIKNPTASEQRNLKKLFRRNLVAAKPKDQSPKSKNSSANNTTTGFMQVV